MCLIELVTLDLPSGDQEVSNLFQILLAEKVYLVTGLSCYAGSLMVLAFWAILVWIKDPTELLEGTCLLARQY